MKYVLGVFGLIVLIIFIIILIARRNPIEPINTSQTGQEQVALTEYEDSPATAQLTMRGEITADEDYRAIRISVSSQERVIEVIQGYSENVIERQTFSNSGSAFATFLSALNHAGFSRETETEFEDERGICPLGRRYIYELQDGSEQVLRLWGTSCSSQQGSFGGDDGVVRDLFENQIPDYRDIVRGVRL